MANPKRNIPKRIFIRNLDFDTTKEELAAWCSTAGTVVDVFPVYQKHSIRNRGFAFVEMSTIEEAENAIRTLDSTVGPGGRVLNVMFAMDNV